MSDAYGWMHSMWTSNHTATVRCPYSIQSRTESMIDADLDEVMVDVVTVAIAEP